MKLMVARIPYNKALHYLYLVPSRLWQAWMPFLCLLFLTLKLDGVSTLHVSCRSQDVSVHVVSVE